MEGRMQPADSVPDSVLGGLRKLRHCLGSWVSAEESRQGWQGWQEWGELQSTFLC